MDTAIIWTALAIGLISAASLPLGTLTSLVWKPSDRWIAFLMSFGGGALLAALTIDLAAPSVQGGRTLSLVVGCMAGGGLFIFLDQLVSKKGGFLRKFSSTVYYLRRAERQRFRSLARKIRRLAFFEDLGADDSRVLAAAVSSLDFKEGSFIFREGDPADYIFLIEDGTVDMFDPSRGNEKYLSLKRGDAFGFLACVTLLPHAVSAVATSDCKVMRIPRVSIQSLLRASWHFQQGIREFIQSEEVDTYLVRRHDVPEEQVHEWIGETLVSLDEGNGVTPFPRSGADSATGRHPDPEQIAAIPAFRDLPREELEEVAASCFLKFHEEGHTFFVDGENSDRFYFLLEGEVDLIDPRRSQRNPRRVRPLEAFGSLSFLTGQDHSTSAMAVEASSVLVLLRHDFNRLCRELPAFSEAIEMRVKDDSISTYLRRSHDFSEDKALTWMRRAVSSLDNGKVLPSSMPMTHHIPVSRGAPLAIWLGILLDGIPESLVIGANVAKGGAVSLSLIGGLFLSNYPEALSSSIGMRQQGMRFRKVLLMWTSLALITGIGAALGSMFFQGVPPTMHSLVEGVAAGAMLTMIAQTMLPEAFLKGGGITGFSTLLGFLAAILLKTLEGGAPMH